MNGKAPGYVQYGCEHCGLDPKSLRLCTGRTYAKAKALNITVQLTSIFIINTPKNKRQPFGLFDQ
jgi:hypothetical protein